MKNPFSLLTKNALSALKNSSGIADKMESNKIDPIHIFLALLFVTEGVAYKILVAMGIDIPQTVQGLTEGLLSKQLKKVSIVEEMTLSSDSKEIVSRAFRYAKERNHVYVGTEHLLLAILEQKDISFVKELARAGLKFSDVEKSIASFTSYPEGILSQSPRKKNGGKPSALEVFGRDITAEAKKGVLDPLVGRDDELDQVINILSRRRKNNPIIVGEAGVGKTAIVEGLAQKIVHGEVPDSLRDTKIISLDVTGLVAGSKMRGDMEEKMMAVIREISSFPNTILFIDEIHTILGVGLASGGGLDLAGVLKPALVDDRFRCIGATTVADYNRYFEEDAALSRRFQKVLINEPSVDDTIKILKRMRDLMEKHHNVVITDEAIEFAVRLSDEYVSDRYLPDKAIDLMDEAAAARRLELEGESKGIGDAQLQHSNIIKAKEGAIKKGDMEAATLLREEEQQILDKISDMKKKRGRIKKSKKYQVNTDIVRKIISRWTGIPLTTLGSQESSELLRLEDTLKERIIGQDEAVGKVANAIKRARTGVTSGERPWASFLFLGPTGVGKTELAKVLTSTLFGEEDRLIQIDMSELMEMHSVSKLIGSPPGYVGYREGGQLTEQVRRNPHSVILFDEIEKAHIDVLNLLLQILEYGHLTDSKGRRVNFKNTVIILTSNIGAEEIKRDKVLGFVSSEVDERSDRIIENAYEGMKESLMQELKDQIRPELLNRLDDIVIFRSLVRADASRIVDLLLIDLNNRLQNQRVYVELEDEAKSFIVEKGFSEEYGARPLRRRIQEYVETPVASYLLQYGGGMVWKGSSLKDSPVKKLLIKKSSSGDSLIVRKSN